MSDYGFMGDELAAVERFQKREAEREINENMTTKNGYKLLEQGTRGALLLVCDEPHKFEYVSAWNYDAASDSWSQGHYFTAWTFTDTPAGAAQFEEDKRTAYAEAFAHYCENYR